MFVITLQRVVTLFVFILLGFFLAKRKILPDNTARVLSLVIVNLFLPAMNFRNLANRLTPEKLLAFRELLLTAVLCVVFAWGVGMLVGRLLSRDSYDRKVLTYSSIIPNYGYMGYPLCLALFGEETLMHLQLFCVPFSIYTYSDGYRMLMEKPFRFRSFLNPPMISILAGVAFGLLQIPIPPLIDGILSDLGDCLGVCAMLLTGVTIAQFRIRDILADWRIYLVSALRTCILPLAAFGIASLAHLSRETRLIMMCVLAMPIGLNGVVYPSSIGKDCRLGAGLACVSNVMAVVTIPLMLSLVR